MRQETEQLSPLGSTKPLDQLMNLYASRVVLMKVCVSKVPAGHQPHISMVKTAAGMHTGG